MNVARVLTLSFALTVVGGASACRSAPVVTAPRPAPPSDWSAAFDRAKAAPANQGRVVLAAPGPARVRLAGGTFTMGSTEQEIVRARDLCIREPLGNICSTETGFIALCLHLELDAHAVTLSPYSIDRTEVSVGAYDRCVAAGACAAPAYERGDPRFDRPELPVTHVRWGDAVQYCAWAGGRLPTEAEWEFAARGEANRNFPWGREWASRRANHGSLSTDETDASDGYALLAPVDSFPDGATPTGIVNVAGNVAEWVQDLVDLQTPDPRSAGYDKAPARNPKGPETGDHLVRGGSYRMAPIFLRSAARFPMRSRPYGDDVGFRCAYD